MGGLSCVAGKPENETTSEAADPDKNVEYTRLHDRLDSQKTSNRNSCHVYCGDPKTNPSKDKPPDGDPATHPLQAAKGSSDTVESFVENGDGKNGGEAPDKDDDGDDDCKDDSESYTDTDDNESKDSVPDIHGLNSPLRFYPPPLIAPFDPKKLRRPRSLDSADYSRSISKSRPLSYSPGLLKTKHPKSLHCITEQVVQETKPKIRQRPQSMDMSSFFEAKGFDVHTQKLRRLLTQKSPRKNKSEQKLNSPSLKPKQVDTFLFVEKKPIYFPKALLLIPILIISLVIYLTLINYY